MRIPSFSVVCFASGAFLAGVICGTVVPSYANRAGGPDMRPPSQYFDVPAKPPMQPQIGVGPQQTISAAQFAMMCWQTRCFNNPETAAKLSDDALEVAMNLRHFLRTYLADDSDLDPEMKQSLMEIVTYTDNVQWPIARIGSAARAKMAAPVPRN